MLIRLFRANTPDVTARQTAIDRDRTVITVEAQFGAGESADPTGRPDGGISDGHRAASVMTPELVKTSKNGPSR